MDCGLVPCLEKPTVELTVTLLVVSAVDWSVNWTALSRLTQGMSSPSLSPRDVREPTGRHGRIRAEVMACATFLPLRHQAE